MFNPKLSVFDSQQPINN